MFGINRSLNTLRPKQNGRHFTDDTFKCIFLNANMWISIKISLKFVPKDPINNIPALVQIMAWRRSGDKPLSEPMMFSLLTHICVTRPQWVNNVGWLWRHWPIVTSPKSCLMLRLGYINLRSLCLSCTPACTRLDDVTTILSPQWDYLCW